MSTDIYLTPDGDLALGQQAVDQDGFLLYYAFQDASQTTLVQTINPEEGSIPIRDVKLVDGEEQDLQLMRTRLMTENPDWDLYPRIGADLTDLIGLPNTQETAELGIRLIEQSLTSDGAFSLNELSVDVVPVGPTTLLFDIKLNRHHTLLRYAGTLDLRLGVWNQFEIGKE